MPASPASPKKNLRMGVGQVVWVGWLTLWATGVGGSNVISNWLMAARGRFRRKMGETDHGEG